MNSQTHIHPQPGHLEPGHPEPGRLEPGHLEPGHLEPGHPEPGRLGASSGAQQPLPFDDEAHEPIGYVLTAAAHREVATGGVPALQVVEGVDDVDDSDTRPASARALRRGGVPIGQIAGRLGVDDLLVRAWIDDGSSAPVATSPVVRARVPSAGRPADGHPLGRLADASESCPATATQAAQEAVTGAALARAAAAEYARNRIGSDPGFAMGLGLLVGIMDAMQQQGSDVMTDPTATAPAVLTLRLPTMQIAQRVMAWLAGYASVDANSVRMVLRLGSHAAGDLARRRWAAAIGVDHRRIPVVRTRQFVDPDGVQALLRITDPDACLILAGWYDAVVWTDDERVDLAF